MNATCVLETHVPWPPSACPEWFVERYQTISIVWASLHTGSLIVHSRNFAVRLVKENFKVSLSNYVIMTDVAVMLSCFFSIVTYSNMYGVHHDDGCTAAIANDLRLSFLLIAL